MRIMMVPFPVRAVALAPGGRTDVIVGAMIVKRRERVSRDAAERRRAPDRHLAGLLPGESRRAALPQATLSA
jgi:hypothetical protein